MTNTETPKLPRSEQARINGAKSQGPTSPEGKARSSRNAIKHGFAATVNNVISVEDEADWELHLQHYRDNFHPQNYVEQTLIDQLASINWRQSRLIAIETALVDFQISLQKDNVSVIYPDCSENPYFHLALAWQSLARQPQRQPAPNPDQPIDPAMPPEHNHVGSIELVRRYLVTLDRQYRNALLNLRLYRQDFAVPPKPKEPEIRTPQPTKQASPETPKSQNQPSVQPKPVLVAPKPSNTQGSNEENSEFKR